MKWTCLSLRRTIGFLMLLLTSIPFSAPVDSGAVVQPTPIPAAQQPYPGPDPHPIPGKIEAEDYDAGGEGVAYHDTTLGNEGGEYRSDDVDIQSTTDGDDGHNVGWIEEGEWLAYTVDVAATGLYDIQVRVASAMGGRRPHDALEQPVQRSTIDLCRTWRGPVCAHGRHTAGYGLGLLAVGV